MKVLINLSLAAVFLMASSLYGAGFPTYQKKPVKKQVRPTIRLVRRYPIVSLDRLYLNRTARRLPKPVKLRLGRSHTGFMWNKGDNNTKKWRPQGITGISTATKKFLLVSWYGRSQASYENRGARVSFVDVTNMSSIKYRHVLLVDKNYKTFKGTHAGGLAIHNNKLYVPETTDGKKVINVFRMNAIEKVPASAQADFYDYGYVLRLAYSHRVSVTPSFLSYDRTRKQFLTGVFDKTRESPLQWYPQPVKMRTRYLVPPGKVKTCGPFFKKMQGAASENGILWVASSYGRGSSSNLRVGRYTPGVAPGNSKFRRFSYLPGLEDIHISKSGNIWLLTEFGPHEGLLNNRIVFATKKRFLMP